MRRKYPAVATALALALLGTSCIGGGKHANAGIFVVDKITGQAQARETAKAAWHEASEGTTIEPTGGLRVAPGGYVTLAHGDRSSVELRPGSGVGEIAVNQPGRLSIVSGDLLVVSDDTAPIAVASQGITTDQATGTYRVDRRLSLRVGVYEGSAAIAGPAGDLKLGTLQEGVVAGRTVPRAASPLSVRGDDVWDRRFLADVLELDRELDSLSRGYEVEFGRRASGPADFAKILRGRNLSFLNAHLDDMGNGDLLIGLVFARLLEARTKGSLGTLFNQLIEQLDQGASWGLLWRELRAPGESLRDAVARAIGVRSGVVPPSKGEITQNGGSGGGGGGGNGGGGNGGGGNGGGPTPTRSPSPSPTHSSTPSPSPTPTHSSSPSPSPSPSPTSSCSVVDEILGNCH